MSACRSFSLVEYCLLILLRITSIAIMCNINHTNGGGILLAVAQRQQPPSSPPAEDKTGGGVFGGTGERAQQVMQCFTGCGQEIVGCGVTCTLGSSQSIEPCFMDCGLSNFVCMDDCFQHAIHQEDAFNSGPVPIH
ncbi:hypothetical protein L1987_65705 [Smallanthus sonchifolius]|uniref:Uncharacterized protein n=1 Tax=Smallanthus sonchifolius TaxID=185202 RepID=A0ACB9BV94_9ASTR|nr:hypothetical protein L1987_65705 [Smallanthus sonchifolius]